METDKVAALCINNEAYAIDIKKAMEYCLKSKTEFLKQKEIVKNYTFDSVADNHDEEESDEKDIISTLQLSSQSNREVVETGNPQDDAIIWDLIKTLIMLVLDTDLTFENSLNDLGLSNGIAFNTLLDAGIIYKIQ